MAGMFNNQTAVESYLPGRVLRDLHPSLAERAALAGLLVNWLTAGRRRASVLDVGCGCAAGLAFLRDALGDQAPDLDYVGLDAAVALVERARASHAGDPACRFLVGDAEALPFPDELYDLTVEFRLFQFLRRPLAALQEMVRVSRGLTLLRIFSTENGTVGFHPMFTRVALRADGGAEPSPALAEAGMTVLYRRLTRPAGEGAVDYPYLRHYRVIPSHDAVGQALAGLEAAVFYRHVTDIALPQLLSPEQNDGPTGPDDLLTSLNVRQTTLVLARRGAFFPGLP